MSLTADTDSGIRAASRAVSLTCSDASPRSPDERSAIAGPQRVRALGRATRSANGCGGCQSAGTVGLSARQSLNAGRRRSGARLRFDAGGPGPLTEDRQKTETRL
jgi:hypothetical protein